MSLAKGNAPSDLWNTLTFALKPPKEDGSHVDIVYALEPLKLSLPRLLLIFLAVLHLERYT